MTEQEDDVSEGGIGRDSMVEERPLCTPPKLLTFIVMFYVFLKP